jgi:pimeloyl-ACP methyl ester carboxylesterase
VLVHAGICDSRMWNPQWDAFAAAHRTVRYDLRGFGRSPLPPQPYSHGNDLIALLRQLGIQQASLVGASLGGRVALEVAVAHPEADVGRRPHRSPAMVDPGVREHVRQMQRRAFQLQLPVWQDADEELLVSDLARRLHEVRAPTLVLVGADDAADFHQIAAQLARQIRGARHAAIANAAHLPSLERPAAFNELVLRFLARDGVW